MECPHGLPTRWLFNPYNLMQLTLWQSNYYIGHLGIEVKSHPLRPAAVLGHLPIYLDITLPMLQWKWKMERRPGAD